MKEGKLGKMITAQEAREKSLYSLQTEQERARQWALGELEYIENQILKEANKGKYEAEYWWSKDILLAEGITQKAAKIALTEILSNVGYQTTYCFNYGEDHNAFKVYIDWEEEY